MKKSNKALYNALLLFFIEIMRLLILKFFRKTLNAIFLTIYRRNDWPLPIFILLDIQPFEYFNEEK
jgi:hypothetical protein